MAKRNEILGVDGQVVTNAAPTIKGIRPCGSQVLVELLTSQEVLGTKVIVEESASIIGAPQGYVIQVGPKVSEDWGFKVGDRVTLHGNFTPLPENIENKNTRRPWILIEPNQIKAILIEK
jgi:hypothetical protein